MSETKKNVFMGDTKLSDEQKESVKQFTENQEKQTAEISAKQIDLQKKKARATLDELLKTRLAPTEDRVVVWPDPVSETTDSGLLVKPQQAIDQERPMTGTVICAGPGKNNENITQELLCEILEEGGASKDHVDSFRKRIKSSTSEYKPGTRVLYGRLAGTPVQDPDTKEELLIMRPTDIFTHIR